MHRRSLAGFLLAVFAAGCAANPFEERATLHQVGDVQMMIRNPELDMAVLQTTGEGEKVCLAPEPDAVPTSSVGFAFHYDGAEDQARAGDGAGMLGGRSPAVLIARDLLYRACEFSLNNKLDADAALSLYDKTLQTISTIAVSETGAGSAPLDAEPSNGGEGGAV